MYIQVILFSISQIFQNQIVDISDSEKDTMRLEPFQGCTCNARAFPQNVIPKSQVGSGCIGGCGGKDFSINNENHQVKKIQVWWGKGTEKNGFKMMIVTLTDNSIHTIGDNGGDMYAQFQFDEGERLKGNLTMCGNGVGTKTGQLAFETSSGRKFEAGFKHTLQTFNVNNMRLTGFFGAADKDIDRLGLLVRS